MTVEFWNGALLMLGALVLAYALLLTSGKSWRNVKLQRLQDMETIVRVLQNDHIIDQQRISQLERELITAKERIQYLEGQLVQKGITEHVYEPPNGERVLLAVVGSEPALKADLAALREVESECGLVVTRCYPVKFTRFEAVLNRYRATGHPIHYVHFSIHVSAETDSQGPGALFEDGLITGEQLSGVMNDVQVAFVAGCDSDMIGDLLGVVPAVVTFREPVRHEHATLATRLFWLAIGRGLTAREAYRETRTRLPSEVAEFLELHL